MESAALLERDVLAVFGLTLPGSRGGEIVDREPAIPGPGERPMNEVTSRVVAQGIDGLPAERLGNV